MSETGISSPPSNPSGFRGCVDRCLRTGGHYAGRSLGVKAQMNESDKHIHTS